MGKMISTLGKRAVRPIKEFNLEERAFKEIVKDKPRVAPRHESTANLIQESVRAQPQEMRRKLAERDDQLVERLRGVYVTSQDVTPREQLSSSRPLPSDRSHVVDPEYGYFEPKSVPYGKITLRNMVEAISKHQRDPELWTAKKLALEYSLDIGLTEKVLKHFRTFVLIVPEESKDAKVIPNLSKTIPFIAPKSLKQLPGFSEKEGEIEGIKNTSTVKS